MFKKTCFIISVSIFLFGMIISYSKPLFYNKSNGIEVYLNSSSSLASMEKVDLFQFIFLKNVKGESVLLDKEGFNLQAFLDEFGAKLKFSESVAEGVSYYAYSPKIPYEKMVNGKLVNLHVFVSKSCVKVGSPIIFGSF